MKNEGNLLAFLQETVSTHECEDHLETKSLQNLIETHAQVEMLYEEALERQEALSRAYYRSAGDTSESRYSGSMHAGSILLESGELKKRDEVYISELPRESFRTLAQTAARRVPEGMLNATRRFILNSCSPMSAEFDEIETELVVLRFQLVQLEEQILDLEPRGLYECKAKLKFMSGMLLNGGEIDQSDFGYLLDEIARAMA